MTTLRTGDFCEAMRFTKGQAIDFEILMMVEAGTNVRAAMRHVCGPVATEENLPAGTTDEALLQAIKDTFFDHITDEQIALAFA